MISINRTLLIALLVSSTLFLQGLNKDQGCLGRTISSFCEPKTRTKVGYRALVETKSQCTPANTSFSCDMNDVFMKRNLMDAIWRHKLAVLKSAFSLKFAQAKKTFKKEHPDATGNQWIAFFEQNDAKGLADMARYIIRNNKPIPGTVSIANELLDKEFSLFHATNMDEQVFEEYRNNKEFSFLKRFSGGLTASNGIQKPDPRFFELLLAKIPAAQKQYAFFIDDSLENVKAAIKAGMIGIHFQSAQQLRAELVRWGILA